MAKRRWAIVGSGPVAGKFIVGLRSAPGAEVSLVASRSSERAASFAAQLGVPRSMGSYEEAAAADVDIAYIATPPSEHRENALLFLRAGKAVVIEKPFASNVADADAIIAAAKTAGLFCMEGMWTRFLPAMHLARKLIADGRIGEPRSLYASFGKANFVDPRDSLFRQELGGGALAHRGVYPITLAIDLLGPASLVSASIVRGETGVDEDATVVLRHESGAISTAYTSARVTADNTLVVFGTEGSLRFVGPTYCPFGMEIDIRPARARGSANWSLVTLLKEGSIAQGLRQRLNPMRRLLEHRRVLHAGYIGNGYAHEAMAAMQALEEGRTEHPLARLAETMAVVRLIEQIKTAANASL